MTKQDKLNLAIQRLILAYKFSEVDALTEVHRAQRVNKMDYVDTKNKKLKVDLNREGRSLIWATIHD